MIGAESRVVELRRRVNWRVGTANPSGDLHDKFCQGGRRRSPCTSSFGHSWFSFCSQLKSLSRREPERSLAKRSGGGGGGAVSSVGHPPQPGVGSPVPVSALCLAALVPARAQNQTSICGLGRRRRHRRLSLDSPASLETRNWEPQEVSFGFLRPIPRWQGLAGCAALHLGYIFFLPARFSSRLRSHLGHAWLKGTFSAVYRHQVSH